MRNILRSILVALVCAILAGCCSYSVATDNGRKMVYAQNNGWFLFGFIPIASGDPEYANKEVSLWFCDSLTLEVNQMLLDEAAKKHGARGFRNLSSYTTSEPVMLFLFKRKLFNSSAELVY